MREKPMLMVLLMEFLINSIIFIRLLARIISGHFASPQFDSIL